MGLYSRHIAPHLINHACGRDDIGALRAPVVPEAEGVVVEIGFGGGRNLPFYHPDRVRRLIATNPPDGFEHLGERAAGAAPVETEFLPAAAEALPLDSGTADTAVLTFTLCSVDDPRQALTELRRVLKPGGRLIVLEHGRATSPGVARWQDRINPIWRPLAAGCNLNRPIRALVEEAGFGFDTIEEFVFPGAPRFAGSMTRGIARSR